MSGLDRVLVAGGGTVALLLVRATIVLFGAWIGSLVLHRSAATVRHLVWLIGIVGVLALPALSRVELFRVAMLPTIAATADPSRTELNGIDRALPVSEGRTVRQAPSGWLAEGRDLLRSHLWSFLFAVWLIVAAGLITWLVAGTFAVRRILRGGWELDATDWVTLMREIADRLGLASVPRLVVSDQVEMAFVCDLLHSAVVLPASASTWSEDRRRSVLLHELAHLRRHDLASHALSRVACALYWFHPLAWAAARRMRAESERACDDIVLSCGARASDYAQQLLEMVTVIRKRGAPVVALPMARPKEFEGRMLAILDPTLSRSSGWRARSFVVIGPCVLLVLSVGAVAPTRRAAAVRIGSPSRIDPVARLAPPPGAGGGVMGVRKATLADSSLVTGNAIRRLFEGIALTPGQEAAVRAIIMKTFIDQWALRDSGGAPAPRIFALQDRRDSALEAQLTTDADRALFDVHAEADRRPRRPGLDSSKR